MCPEAHRDHDVRAHRLHDTGRNRIHDAAVDEGMPAEPDRRIDARDRRRRKQSEPEVPVPEHHLFVRVDVGRDDTERNRKVLDLLVGQILLNQLSQRSGREEPLPGKRRAHHRVAEQVEQVGAAVGVVADRVETGDRGADARAGQEVDRDAVALEDPQDADVRVPA